ncbi:MAG: dUTP diphosphatase [Anaerovoracaceae bacterium]
MAVIKVVNKSEKLPAYETIGSAGMDVRAFINEPIILSPGQRALIPTGLFFEIPLGYEVQVRARSGLAINHGICLINGIGTVDSDYRGEIKVPLVNLGQEDFEIKNGERIGQIVLSKYEQITWQQVERLSETDRGKGGFGHTGK